LKLIKTGTFQLNLTSRGPLSSELLVEIFGKAGQAGFFQ
jgi:hypothetical protein